MGLVFSNSETHLVDSSNLSLLAGVAIKIKEVEDQETENHAAVSGRTIKLKQEGETDHDDSKDESRRRQVTTTTTTTNKGKQEHHRMMPCNSNEKLMIGKREARPVDSSRFSSLVEVAIKIKEAEDQETENHAAVSGRTIKLKQEGETDHDDSKDEISRPVMTMTTTKKRKQEHHHMMPCNSNKKPMIGKVIPSLKSSSSSDHHCSGWIEAHVRLRASPPIWICDKRLTSCDTRRHQNRLLLRTASVKDWLIPHLSENQKHQVSYALKEDEGEQQQQQQRKKCKEGLQVVTIDEVGRCWNNMWLKQWATGYALKGEWTKIVQHNRFAGGKDTVQVYAFKYGAGEESLGFAVIRLTPVE